MQQQFVRSPGVTDGDLQNLQQHMMPGEVILGVWKLDKQNKAAVKRMMLVPMFCVCLFSPIFLLGPIITFSITGEVFFPTLIPILIIFPMLLLPSLLSYCAADGNLSNVMYALTDKRLYASKNAKGRCYSSGFDIHYIDLAQTGAISCDSRGSCCGMPGPAGVRVGVPFGSPISAANLGQQRQARRGIIVGASVNLLVENPAEVSNMIRQAKANLPPGSLQTQGLTQMMSDMIRGGGAVNIGSMHTASQQQVAAMQQQQMAIMQQQMAAMQQQQQMAGVVQPVMMQAGSSPMMAQPVAQSMAMPIAQPIVQPIAQPIAQPVTVDPATGKM